MAPKYKLTYFPVMGQGEPIRLLLAYGKVEYEDVRLTGEEWPELKHTMPFGKVPVLEIDGKVIHQSVAISRHLGKQFKIAGENDWEDLECDMMVDTILDLRSQFRACYHEKDDEKKGEMKEMLIKETIPYYLKRLDAEIKKNNGHFVRGKLTWTDLYFTAFIDYSQAVLKTDFIEAEDYPNVKALVENVKSIPSIKSWIEKRPKSEF